MSRYEVMLGNYMSLDYIRVLDDRISSLLKVEGLVITILVATVSITLGFGMLIPLSWIIISLILFLIFFIFTLVIYARLSSHTFKKREESSEKYDALLTVRRWQNNYESIAARISEDALFTAIDNNLQINTFLETQPYEISPVITNVINALRASSNIPQTGFLSYYYSSKGCIT